MSIQSQIIASTRRSGNTTWILKAAIDNPNCIIVCRDANQANYQAKLYNKMILNQPWYKKLWWKIVGREEPVFASVSDTDAFRYASREMRAVIFDNSAIK